MDLSYTDYKLDEKTFKEKYNVQETADGGYYGLSSANIKHARDNTGISWHMPFLQTIFHEIYETLLEPINQVVIAASIALVLIYICTHEEPEHVTVCLFTFIIMALNFIISIYNRLGINKLIKLSAPVNYCRVYRDGTSVNITKEELVQGDILILSQGDTVQADCRLIKANNIYVDPFIISGKSEHIPKNTRPSNEDYKMAGNMLFEGYVITAGSCCATVLKTGSDTLYSKMYNESINNLSASAKHKNDIEIFFNLSFVIATGISLIIVVLQPFILLSSIQMAVIIVSVYISILPEGIPSLTKLLQYSAALRLRRREVLVRDVNAIPKLADATILCIEKDALGVADALMCEMIYNGEKMINVEGTFRENSQQDLEYFRTISKAYALAAHQIPVNGNTSDNISFFGNTLHDFKFTRDAVVLFGEICKNYFNEQADFTSKKEEYGFGRIRISLIDAGKYNILYAIGHPDAIIDICRLRIKRGCIQRLNSFRRKSMKSVFKQFETGGYKLVGLAMRAINKKDTHIYHSHYTFISYMCLKNIVKLDAPMTMGLILASGMSICLLHRGSFESLNNAGDDLLESLNSINKELPEDDTQDIEPNNLDILQYSRMHESFLGENGLVMGAPCMDSGTSNLTPMGQKGLGLINGFIGPNIRESMVYCGDTDDFEQACVSGELPSSFFMYNVDSDRKLAIVTQLQNEGHVVAYLGEREDDFKAMRAADISICSAAAPSICRDIASLVLPNLQVNGIIFGVEEGRLHYVNLQKGIKYIMMHITPQVISILAFAFLSIPLPISPLLLIFLNYLVEVFPAAFLAHEKPEYNLITAGPKTLFRNQRDHVVNIPMVDNGYFSRLSEWKSRISRLINGNSLYSPELLRTSLVESGIITFLGCITSFYLALTSCGIPLSKCIFISHIYFRYHAPNLDIGNNISLNYGEQLYILYRAQSTFYLGLVFCQLCNLLVCRRTHHLFTKNITDNLRLVLFTGAGIAVSCILIYMPWFENFLLIRKPVLLPLIVPVISGLSIVLLDSARKLRNDLYK